MTPLFSHDDEGMLGAPIRGDFGSGLVPPIIKPPAGAGAPVVVVDTDVTIRNRLAMQVGDFAAALPTIEALVERLSGDPMVVILGPSFASEDGLNAAEKLIAENPELGTILVTAELSTDLFRQALRSGVKDVLPQPVDAGQLGEAVRRVVDGLAVRRSDEASADVDPGELGRVITVFSTKGGAGKSVLAANLAVVLAKRTDKPVVLVDGDLQFGDVAVMLKLAPQHTIVDAVGSIDRLDPALLQNLLIRHEQSGIYVMPAPLEPALADQVSAEDMVKIVEMLRTFAEYVVVDTPAYFNDVVLGLIEISDDVLLIAGMDIPNIKNVKIGLQTLKMLNTPMSKLRLILNRANSKVKLDVGEVERTLQIKADALIPSDIVVPQSVNKGTPVVLDSPRSSVAKSIEQLADHFADRSGRTGSSGGTGESVATSGLRRWRNS